MSTTSARVPAGTLVAIGPTGPDRAHLITAVHDGGLRTGRVLSHADARRTHARTCADLAHRVRPETCTHVEEAAWSEMHRHIERHHANGHTWLLDTAALDLHRIAALTAATRRSGGASTALVRTTPDGQRLSREQFTDLVRAQGPMPERTLEQAWQEYTAATDDALRAAGFDVIQPWHPDLQLTVMPDGPDARHVRGNLAIIGDIHGCAETFFERLLPALGTDRDLSNPDIVLVSVGDLCDKGQHSVEVMRWWLWALRTGRALCVDSNHNAALLRALSRPELPVKRSQAQTVAQIDAEPDAEQLRADIIASFSRLPSHLVFPDHVVAHAAMTQERLFATDESTRNFAMYTRNDATPWEWTGTQTLVHGHVIVGEPERRRSDVPHSGEVVAIDTGAYEGGGLSAYLTATGHTLTVPSVTTDQMDPERLARHRARIADMLARREAARPSAQAS